MENLMNGIVYSDVVQGLLEDVHFSIENDQITVNEYKSICAAVQEMLDNDKSLLLEPLQIAMLIEDALIIHSALGSKVDAVRSRHIINPSKSVRIAFNKQFGEPKQKQLN